MDQIVALKACTHPKFILNIQKKKKNKFET